MRVSEAIYRVLLTNSAPVSPEVVLAEVRKLKLERNRPLTLNGIKQTLALMGRDGSVSDTGEGYQLIGNVPRETT